jgi:hypothetical protein
MAENMLQLYGSCCPGIPPVVMFHELGVAVRLIHQLTVLFIMVEKGKPGMVPCCFALVKLPHQGIEPVILNCSQ